MYKDINEETSRNYLILCAMSMMYQGKFEYAKEIFENLIESYKAIYGEGSEKVREMYVKSLPIYLKSDNKIAGLQIVDNLILNVISIIKYRENLSLKKWSN